MRFLRELLEYLLVLAAVLGLGAVWVEYAGWIIMGSLVVIGLVHLSRK